MTRRLGSVLGAAVICLLVWAGSAVALSYDGTASVEYSGTVDQSFVYQPADPSVWQGTLHFVFDEKTTVAFYGRAQDRPTTKVLSHSLTISGTFTNTYRPPNQGLTCSGSLSARPGAPDPFQIYYGTSNPPAVGVTANVPIEGFYVQSSSQQQQCAVMNQAGGPGFVSPLPAIAAELPANPAHATVVLPSNTYSKSYTASGSDPQTTESFHSTLEVSTSGGPTGGPGPQKRTPAQIQAKRNALQALQQSVPASLYPCFSTAAGTALFATGVAGQIAGGTLIAIAGPLCVGYNAMIQSEVQTINDPPRSDYDVLVPIARARAAVAPTVSCKGLRAAAARACAQARPAAQKLLARTRASARLATAIEVTISRETGAQHHHNKQAAARQNRMLIALNKSFAHARRLERAAGSALAKILRSYGVSIRMSSGQVRTAQSGLLTALAAHKMTAANVRLVKRALKGRGLNVLNTLGR